MKSVLRCVAAVAVVASLPWPEATGAQGTLFVEGSNVGIGIETPAVPLHILQSTGADTTMFRLQNNGGNRFDFVNTFATHGGWWQFINTSNPGGADLVIREITKNGTEEFRLTETGNLKISGQLVTGGPSCSTGCDRVFAVDHELKSIAEHAALMWERGFLPAVGPTVEGAPINLTETTGGVLHELEVAHVYIERLHRQIEQLNERLARVESKLGN